MVQCNRDQMEDGHKIMCQNLSLGLGLRVLEGALSGSGLLGLGFRV